MNHTKIEWVRNPDGSQGYTFNPITGCLNHVNGLCKGGGFPCYAYRLANGRLKHLYLANVNLPELYQGGYRVFDGSENESLYYEHLKDPFYPRFWPERLGEITNKLRRWGRNRIVHAHEPRGVFVCDMSDLFGTGIPEEWTRRVLGKMQYAKQDRFFLLTKQPQNLIKFSPFPPNCWVGATVCTNGAMTLALEHLSNIQAKVKFISFEPLLGFIGMNDHMNLKGIVDWVIIGAQTKPSVFPKIEWVQEIVEAADKAGIPVFLKDNLYPIFNVETEEDAFKLHIDYPWAFSETIFSGENTEIKYNGRVTNLRQEMPS